MPQFDVVVDFSVDGDRIAAAVRLHRLVTQRRQIDDAQPPMSQRHPRCGPGSAVVRPAVGDPIGQALEQRTFAFSPCADDPVNPTHQPAASEAVPTRPAGTPNLARSISAQRREAWPLLTAVSATAPIQRPVGTPKPVFVRTKSSFGSGLEGACARASLLSPGFMWRIAETKTKNKA